MKRNYIGSISNYFSNIYVAAFEIESGKFKVGDTVHIKGYITGFYGNHFFYPSGT